MAGLFLNNLAHTESGVKLDLTSEQEELCRVVYRRHDEEKNIFIFDSLWLPEAEYSYNHIIVPIRSTYDGLSDEYPAGTCFANVEGSGHDPQYHNPYSPAGMQWKISWIALIRKAYNGTNYSCTSCCANQTVYKSADNTSFIISCSSFMHGAHVLLGSTESKDPLKTKDAVFLLPLCSNHNTYSEITGHYGTGYYMKLNRNMKAVKLRGYMKEPEPGTLL